MSEAKIICKDCKKEFILTAGEFSFYTSHNLEIPKRCAECRKARKNGKNK